MYLREKPRSLGHVSKYIYIAFLHVLVSSLVGGVVREKRGEGKEGERDDLDSYRDGV